MKLTKKMALETLSLQEIKGCYVTAKDKLNVNDRANIEGCASVLVIKMKSKSAFVQLSPEGALEVLAEVGWVLETQ